MLGIKVARVVVAGWVAAFSALALGCEGAPDEEGIEATPEGGGEGAVGSVSDAASTNTTFLQGKLFGYIFGDGNYVPHMPAPKDASFQTPLQVVARDFVLAACKSGYAGRVLSEHEAPSKRRIDCATFNEKSTLTKGSNKYSLVIEGFTWPGAGSFDKFATGASQTRLKGFLSGLLPTEGTRTGLILDQFPDSSYNDAQIDLKLHTMLKVLDRLDFTTARMERDGKACTSHCRTITINAEAEGCKLNASYGYDFAHYARVPGAYGCEGLSCKPPKACGAP